METIDVFLTEESLTKTKSHRFCLWLNFPSLKFTPNDIFRQQLYFQTTADISTHAIFAKTECESKPTLFLKQTLKDLSWHILSSLYKKMRWISEQQYRIFIFYLPRIHSFKFYLFGYKLPKRCQNYEMCLEFIDVQIFFSIRVHYENISVLLRTAWKFGKKKKKTIGKIFSFNGKVSKYIYDLTNVNNTNDLSAASKYLVSVVCCREKMLSLNFFLCETGFYFAQTYPQMSNIPAKYLLSNISCWNVGHHCNLFNVVSQIFSTNVLIIPRLHKKRRFYFLNWLTRVCFIEVERAEKALCLWHMFVQGQIDFSLRGKIWQAECREWKSKWIVVRHLQRWTCLAWIAIRCN